MFNESEIITIDNGLTAIVRRSITGKGYVGTVNEVPGAASEGDSIPELINNLNDAVRSVKQFESENHYRRREVEAENNELKADIAKAAKLVLWQLIVIICLTAAIIILLTTLS